MYAYYEVKTSIPNNHQLHIQLPDSIPVGQAKIAVIYEQVEAKNNAGLALEAFLNKYQAEEIDIETSVFEAGRKRAVDRDFQL